ncbi:MAG: tryptophan 7-halogenase [Planctomyces sp.]|nr:tryptophan 7-halogenase [Planctomyces sp.]
MSQRDFDVAILGAGFGGSLMAILLRRLGRSVLLLDRQRHPRFAIGESSTPAADFTLERICDEFDLPRLRPLARYGSWKSELPQIACGLKRGFSYFHHASGREFETDAGHSHELLVSASRNDAVSDTHWYRADVDSYFCEEAAREGVVVEEGVETAVEPGGQSWRVRWSTASGDRGGEAAANFLIDASGAGGVLPRLLKIEDRSHELQTRSRSVFKHVLHLPRWSDELERLDISTKDHPYPCDDAALHHVFEGGWMWVLRFENGITSVGISLDPRRPANDALTPDEEFQALLVEHPSLERTFRPTRIPESFPSRSCIRTGRLQRLWGAAAGPSWCLLPNCAGFIDAFYSTGIAQTLCGLKRIAEAFRSWNDGPRFDAALAGYSRAVADEIMLIDDLVSTSYACMGRHPEWLHACSAVYFAAATSFERRFHAEQRPPGFLLADDPQFRATATAACARIREGLAAGPAADVAVGMADVARTIAPWNVARLLDPASRRMYHCTAAK